MGEHYPPLTLTAHGRIGKTRAEGIVDPLERFHYPGITGPADRSGFFALGSTPEVTMRTRHGLSRRDRGEMIVQRTIAAKTGHSAARDCDPSLAASERVDR